MASTEIDNIDKLYKNYDILNDAQDKISEVSFSFNFFFFFPTTQILCRQIIIFRRHRKIFSFRNLIKIKF